VKEEGGAGLDLEASEYGGYLVESLEEDAGQDERLVAGSVVIAIDGVPLMGLGEDDLGETFGAHFKVGAQMLFLPGDELKNAVEKHEASLWALAQVVLTGKVEDGKIASFKGDLGEFASRGQVRASFYECPGTDLSVIFLAGVRLQVNGARPELEALLNYYGMRGVASSAEKRKIETIEAGGMVMQSLPARNRRRRIAPDVVEEVEGNGDGKEKGNADAEGEEGEGEPSGNGSTDSAAHLGESPKQYEYMDHTADVILHSWGTSLEQAMAQVCEAFFAYMTEIDQLERKVTFEVEASGHDMVDMLYHLLDEFLFHFGTTYVMCNRCEVLSFDKENFKVKARGYGEKFDLKKHPQGTEIKAITMHQMKVLTPETLTTEKGTILRTSDLMEGGTEREGFPYECYVLVDI